MTSFSQAQLQAIAEADVPAILQKLEETRRVAADAPARDAALAETVSRQADLLKKMNQVLDLMDKSEGFQEAVNWLYEIQKLQQDVYDRTLKDKAERVKGVIEGKPAGGDKPNPKEKQPDEKQKPAPPGK